MNDSKKQISSIMSALNDMLRALNTQRTEYTSIVQQLKTELFELSVRLDELNRTKNSYLGHSNTHKHVFSPITPTVENEVKELKLAKEITLATQEQEALLAKLTSAEESLNETETKIHSIRTARIALVDLGKDLTKSQSDAKKYASLFLDYVNRLKEQEEKNEELEDQIEELKAAKDSSDNIDDEDFSNDEFSSDELSDDELPDDELPDNDPDDDEFSDDDFEMEMVSVRSPFSPSTDASEKTEDDSEDDSVDEAEEATDDIDTNEAENDSVNDTEKTENASGIEEESENTASHRGLGEHGENILMLSYFEKTFLASVLDRRIRSELHNQEKKLEILESIAESEQSQEIIADLQNSNHYLDVALKEQLRKLYYYFNDNCSIGILLDDYLTHFRDRHPEYVIESDFDMEDYEQVLSYTKALSLIVLLNIFTDNIVHHSNATRIQLKINIDSSDIRVILSDNGIGISEDKLEKSYWYSGIHKAKEILFLLDGTISITGSNDGTKIEFQYSAV